MFEGVIIGKGKLKYLEKDLSYVQFVHHKCHMKLHTCPCGEKPLTDYSSFDMTIRRRMRNCCRLFHLGNF
jgi:hypothetical protein